MKRRVTAIGAGAGVIMAVAATGTGVASVDQAAERASFKRCGAVVKKIYPLDPEIYKTKVFAVGPVGCGEARRIIRRSLQPGGFNGNISGWRCESRGGSFDRERCVKDNPRRVVKSGSPRVIR